MTEAPSGSTCFRCGMKGEKSPATLRDEGWKWIGAALCCGDCVARNQPDYPDLSSLDKRQRLNVKVAEVAEETRWTLGDSGCMGAQEWLLEGTMGEGGSWLPYLTIRMTAPVGMVEIWHLPDYAGDPAAWGALMEREHVWTEPIFEDDGSLRGWEGCWISAELGPDWPQGTQHTHQSAGEAVACAVLRKHGIDPTPYIGD